MLTWRTVKNNMLRTDLGPLAQRLGVSRSNLYRWVANDLPVTLTLEQHIELLHHLTPQFLGTYLPHIRELFAPFESPLTPAPS